MIPVNDEIRVEVTTRCNYNCLICPRERLTRKLDTMSLSMFKLILDKILTETKQYRVCTFSGYGEPLMDPTILGKIEHARAKGLQVLMLTNASLLTVEKFKKLDKLGVDSIRVSFYGASPSVYNKVHNINNKHMYNRIRKRLTEICDLKKNTEILLTYNVEEFINKSDTENWIKYWKDKADLLEVWTPHNWVDGRLYRKVQKQKLKTCGRPWKTPLQVQVDGTVNMCCFDFDGQLTLGDLKTQSLKEIFSSALYRKIKKHHVNGRFKGSKLICENCDQRNADKEGVMLYNSKFDINERVKMVSTTYKKVNK